MSGPLESGLEVLRARFRERVRGDLATLNDALDALEGGRRTAAEVHAEMRAVLHRLAGAAGSFGWPEIGTLAGTLEQELGAAPDPGADPVLTAARWRAGIAELARRTPPTGA